MEIRHIVILNYDICFTLNGAKLAYISIDIINFQQSFDEKYWWIHAEITKIWRLQKLNSIMTDIDHRRSKSVIQGDGKPSGWCKVVILFFFFFGGGGGGGVDVSPYKKTLIFLSSII